MAEESYEDVAAHFDNILSSVSNELKEFVDLQGKEQHQAYVTKCMEWIRGVHGSLDGTQFIPMIVMNVTTHHALALNQRVNQSQIPLQIMTSPMCTQATAMGAGLKFVKFLAKQVLALDVKLGPVSAVSLESGGEGAGVQSTSGMGSGATPMITSPPTLPGKHDSSKTPFTVHTPPTTDHTYGVSKAKTPDTPTKPKTMLSPKASASFAKFMGMSDEGMSQKRHGKSASREVPSKKAKVDDDSDSYSSPTPSKSNAPKKEAKKRKTKKKMHSSDDECSYASAEERATPKKSNRDEKAEQIAWTNWDRASKWKKDLAHVDRYHQRKGLCTKELDDSPSNARHVDLLTQLLGERQLGLNVVHIEEHLDEVTEDSSSKQACRLLRALKEVRGETMGHSGVYPEYVMKAFLAPQSQCVIQKGDNNHWDTSAMIGLYNLHKYEAVGKGNKKVDDKMVTKGYCPFCIYSAGNNGSINNHIRVHYRLVLECGFANCSVIMYDAERMVNHAKDKHKLETDA